MTSDADSVEFYLANLPEDRRTALSRVRDLILDRLPEGYEESMRSAMISYEIPLSIYPDTYNGSPLQYAALTSQKRHMAVYLMGMYANAEAGTAFEQAYRATGKRYDAGKACVRFRTLDDLPLELIGQTIASTSVEGYIELYEAAQRR